MHYNVPLYVEAAFEKIGRVLEIVQWNINQEVFESPFDNTANAYYSETFEVIAYDWDDNSTQTYNFKWRDYEVSWYKYCGRGMSANRDITPEECSVMLSECIESLRLLNKGYSFDNVPEQKYCIQCFSEDVVKKLESGVWVCKDCLDALGKEQSEIREEIINQLFEFGFDNYQDICDIIQVFENIIDYMKHTSVRNMKSLKNTLGAVRQVIALQNDLLDDKEKEEILDKFTDFVKDLS